MQKISIVVPCYNEEEMIPIFKTEILKIAEVMSDVNFEVIFINDGSRDRTLEVLREVTLGSEMFQYISLSRNFGKEPAMLAGFEKVTGDYVAIMDVDLQDPPELLLEMYQILQEGEYDCVATRRITRKGEPILRTISANAFYFLINKISDTQIVNGARDYRLMTRQMLDSILEMKEYNRFSKGLFSFVGYNTKWLDYENIERIAGKTSWNFWGLFKYSLEGILSFSTLPLHISSIAGMLTCVAAFIYGTYIATRTLIFGDPVAGFTTLACLILFLGGIQLLTIGILGQYVAKMYLETKQRPVYIIKEESKSNNHKETL